MNRTLQCLMMVLLFAGGAWAANIQAVLDSADGSSALQVLDQQTNEVFRVNSLGQARMTGTLDMNRQMVTGAVYYGDGQGLTNIPASGVAEADPVWNAQKAGYATGTPLYAYIETDPVWSATSNGVMSQLAVLQTNVEARLASNVWAAAASTTNYVARTGDTMTGTLAVQTNLVAQYNTDRGGGVRSMLTVGGGQDVEIGAGANGYNLGAAIGVNANGSGGVAVGAGAQGAGGAALGYQADGNAEGVAVGSQAYGYDGGSAVGHLANAYDQGAALGHSANGQGVGVAVGAQADGNTEGAAIGRLSVARNRGVAAGYQANGMDSGSAIGYAANAAGTNIAIGSLANAQGGAHRIAIGSSIVNTIDDSARLRGTLYLDGGTGIYYRATAGSGAWARLADGSTLDEMAGLQTNVAARLASNVWAAAAATTNYVARTGDTMSGTLAVNAPLIVNYPVDRGTGTRNMLTINGGTDVEIGPTANGYNNGVAIGELTYAPDHGVAVGTFAKADSYGVALGYYSSGTNGLGVGAFANGNNNGAAVGNGAVANRYGTALGSSTYGSDYGTAVGALATGTNRGVAVGYGAAGDNYGTALGQAANGEGHGVGVGALAIGNGDGVAVGYEAVGSSGGAAVGRGSHANESGAELGYQAYGVEYGAAVGYTANGYENGTAVGYDSDGNYNGTALGYEANGRDYGVALGRSSWGYQAGIALGISANGINTNIAIGFQANAAGGSDRIAIGRGVTNNVDHSVRTRGDLYLDGGTGICYRASFGSNVWYLMGTRRVVLGFQTNDVITLTGGEDVAIADRAFAFQRGIAIGPLANAHFNSIAMGRYATASNEAVALGVEAKAESYGVALGYRAVSDYGVALGYHAYAFDGGVALGSWTVATGGTERVAIGNSVQNDVDNSTRIRGNLYLDGCTGIMTRATFGSGAWAAKTFLIDHPLDPENKVLRHYCMEGPAVQNNYNGTRALDENGEAVIELPDYFEALNIHPQYHLTPVGAQMNLYVKEEIRDNRFVVAGGVPGGKVCWMVIAQRNDPACQADVAHRPVEQLKSELPAGQDLRENQVVNTGVHR